MGKRVTTKQAMEHVARKMDDREDFKMMLRAFIEKHGYCPKRFEAEWEIMKNEKPWRQDPKCLDKLRKAARQMAQNENKRRRKRAAPPTT